MDTELLIFSLISLIILIPIIYFLPLNLTKKGKLTVIAVSFLIALAGLWTKVFMQLWQSILLLVGLILLLSMVLTKKYSPALFTMPDGSSKGMSSDENEKDMEISNFTKLESLPVIDENEMKENQGIKNEPLELEKMNSNLNVELNDEEYRGNELEELYSFESNEYKENEFIYPSEDASYSPSLESTSTLEKDEASSLSDMELEEMQELEPISLEKQPQAESEEIPVGSGASSYLGELEELMLESQTESAAAAELLDASETEKDPISEAEEVVQLDDAADIEAMLNNQRIVETESANESPEEAVAEEETKQISMDEYPVLDELSDEDVQAVFNEEVVNEEAVAEEPVVEIAPLDMIEAVQTAGNEEERGWELPIHENSNAEMEHNNLSSEEQWNQMETPEAIQEAVQETDMLPEEQPVYPQENKKRFEHKEVVETLFLQAEIAKKMEDKEQFEQIVESFLNYEDSEDERYKMVKILVKDYINIMK